MVLDYLLEHNRYCNVMGIVVILAIAFLFSSRRSRINYQLVAKGLLLQIALGLFMLKTSIGVYCVQAVAQGVVQLFTFAGNGAQFVFGALANPAAATGFIFAFTIFPVIIFFASLMSLLFYLGIAQRIVSFLGAGIRPILGTTGAETACAVANSFLGQTEAPLLVKHYLKDATKSELFAVMVAGMGTISGAILVSYVVMGVPAVHLLTSCVMSIPSTLIIAKMLMPETEKNAGEHVRVNMHAQTTSANVFDAIAGGALEGLNLVLAIGAVLIAFLAFIALADSVLEYAAGTNLKVIFSWVFSPFGYLLGLEGDEVRAAGQLIGIKVSVNELIAYGEMVKMNLSERAVALLTYALCGFSSFCSIGIQIGGIGALIPEKRSLIAQLGLLAVLGGTLSNLLCAMIAGLLL